MLSRGFKEQIYDVFKFLPEKVRSSVIGRMVDFVDLDGLMRMDWMYRLARYSPSVEFGDWYGRAMYKGGWSMSTTCPSNRLPRTTDPPILSTNSNNGHNRCSAPSSRRPCPSRCWR